MPRLNASHSQSYVLGGGAGDANNASDLPRFERPVLKQAKSAYSSSSNSSPRGFSKSLSSGGFFRGGSARSNSHDERQLKLPLTTTSTGNAAETPNKPRSKLRAAVSGCRDGTTSVLPDWTRTTPSPSSSLNANHLQQQQLYHVSPSNHNSKTRVRTNSEVLLLQSPGNHHNNMSTSLRDCQQQQHDYHDTEDEEEHTSASAMATARRRSSTHSPHLQKQALVHEDHIGARVLRQRKGDIIQAIGLGQHRQQQRQQPPHRATSGNNTAGVAVGAAEESPYRLRRGSKFMPRVDSKSWRAYCGYTNNKWTVGQVLQGAFVLLVTFLLYDGHHKANLIAFRLKEFKTEEAMLFLHLHRIEQQSIQLHEALQRLDRQQQQQHQQRQNKNSPDKALSNTSNNNGEYTQDKVVHGYNNSNNKQPQQPPQNSPNVDSALIQKQTQQLMQMEEELSHEVRTLQTRIQHSAVRSIVHEYGEGPVQVILEVVGVNDINSGGQQQQQQPTAKISILLWHDTPHAAWTWLEQISKKLWDGAIVHLENNRILGIGSPYEQVNQEARLDFIERSQQRHEAWTVGLTDVTIRQGGAGGGSSDNHNNGDGGGLQLFINLQDNTDFSKHNVCIGKVFDGFDVLHKMVEQTRRMQLMAGHGGQQQLQAIAVKTARASHLTNRETKGLI